MIIYCWIEKLSSNFKSAIIGEIFTYKILCVDYKGYKLARFMDKNVSISCSEQLIISIRTFCHEDSSTDTEIKIPADSIIETVGEKFGYFLPYLLLKRSKRIKKVIFEKLLDENYKIQDVITIKKSDYVRDWGCQFPYQPKYQREHPITNIVIPHIGVGIAEANVIVSFVLNLYFNL